MRTLVGVLALSLSTCAVYAGSSVSVVPSGAGTVESLGQDRFLVIITAPAGSTVTVLGDENPILEEVRITASASSGEHLDLSINDVGSVFVVNRTASNPVALYLRNLSSSGTIWAVEATQIGDITTSQNILGPISATGTLPLPAPTAAGIGSIVSTSNYITADVTVDHGSNIGTAIGAIRALEKTIGTPSAPVTISARGPIGEIRADAIYANIDTFQTSIGEIESQGNSGFSGDFVGSLSASTINSQAQFPIDVRGNLDANLTFTQPVNNRIRVGKSFLSGRTISFPERGLEPQAQVTFNDKNLTPQGQWLGTVTVGSTTLSPVPDYTQAPRDLGPVSANDGGSVGLAEFRFHGNGSEPRQGSTVNAGTLCVNCTQEPPPCVVSFKTAIIRHYGPIEINTTVGTFESTNVYRVEHSLNNSTWDNVSDQFRVRTTDVFQIQNDGRDWVLQRRDNGDFAEGFYKVTLLANTAGNPSITRLRSNISGNGAWAPSYEYRFKLIANCNADIESLFDVNNDSWINANDIGAWLMSPTDLNADNAVDGADLNRIVIGVAMYGN